MPGYSGKPLWAKLGVKEGSRLVIRNNTGIERPAYELELPWPLTAGKDYHGAMDIVHIFVDRRTALEKEVLAILAIGKDPAMAIWISWPKKASRLKTDITEDMIREVILPLGLVDIKVCSVSDETWSGLKVVIRRENRHAIVGHGQLPPQAHNCLYFHCANKGDKLDFIARNPRACATLIKDNGYLETKCDHDYETLVIRGSIQVVAGLEEKQHGLQVLLGHLEKDPRPIFERNIKDDSSYNGVTILRLDMDSIIGKKYQG